MTNEQTWQVREGNPKHFQISKENGGSSVSHSKEVNANGTAGGHVSMLAAGRTMRWQKGHSKKPEAESGPQCGFPGNSTHPLIKLSTSRIQAAPRAN